jgi:FkbM family methyltransferase
MSVILDHVRRAIAIHVARPYIVRELPGWGRLYRYLVGSFENDSLWAGQQERWIRGKLHGYEMPLRISGWSNRGTYFLGRFYDLPTQLLIQQRLKAGDTFVDIGANEGMISLVASRAVGPTGRVIAFEPNPSVRSVLTRTIHRNSIRNIEVEPYGVSDAPGELTLFVPDINTGEGTFTPLHDVAGSSVTCPVVRGDEALANVSPTLIKIDVEGF